MFLLISERCSGNVKLAFSQKEQLGVRLAQPDLKTAEGPVAACRKLHEALVSFTSDTVAKVPKYLASNFLKETKLTMTR